ncbi:MAG TPA: energy-coupling factor transporter ATPase [Clostridiaceae bacterium]|nr:energy-coupling factor transporter ATPase [Clostridiaceae bacterium]
MTNLITVNDVGFSYNTYESEPVQAVEHVSFTVKPGEYVAILGRNGSGKSTLAKLLNGLELPEYGNVVTAGYDTTDDRMIFEIRRTCGMVFQNPDNQIVGTTVEEDVAFGPENLGVPLPELAERVRGALKVVGLREKGDSSPSALSGGQKQKLAIAGVLAMRPSCLILDEATAMLDPVSRHELLELVLQLRSTQNLTIINITHHMEEVLQADKVMVMDQGHVLISGRPADIFHNVAEIRRIGLDVPMHTGIVYRLAQVLGKSLVHKQFVDEKDAVAAVRTLLKDASETELDQAACRLHKINPSRPYTSKAKAVDSNVADIVVAAHGLSYVYDGAGIRTQALRDISFQVHRGECFGIMGHTGSGKSTLIQHLNGLLRKQKGKLRVLNYDLSHNSDIRLLRRHVGLLFQYPEHQLFAETCREDIAYGPTQLGLSEADVAASVEAAAAIVGLDEETLDKSPFELSGGQKRRVALAGILAMEPDILILDEPAAGLDPAGRAEIRGYVEKLRAFDITVILVSHNMDELAYLADRILVLNQGTAEICDTPDAIFSRPDILARCDLTVPRTVHFLQQCTPLFPHLDVYRYDDVAAALSLIEAALEQAVKQNSDRPLRSDSSGSGGSDGSEGTRPTAVTNGAGRVGICN